ncbi:MAG: CRTAC1 family protein [Phycisphaerales bacterium]|nr:CRTAC1 family protein [Phycisphaerales bacterium]
MTEERESWEGARSSRDSLVGLVVGIGLGAVLLIVLAIFLMKVASPELFDRMVRRNRQVNPTLLTAASMPPFTASFTDVAAEAGVTKVQSTGATGERLLPETMGSGIALGDLDGDQDADLLLLSYGSTPALYRNDSPQGGPIRFTDVTDASGLGEILHSTTSALGDFDGDGRVDVLIGTVGPDRLFRNTGSLRFEEVASLGNGWTSATGFADIDNDGDLDLVAASYVEWSPEIDREVDYTLDGIGRAYGPPNGFKATDLALYINHGDGVFRDEAGERGLHVRRDDRDVPVMKALGLLLEDIVDDQNTTSIDILVANDTTANRLFLNDGLGNFTEVAAGEGVAYDIDGKPTGAMGVDITSFDYDTWVAIGNFANEPSSCYSYARWRSGSGSRFTDRSATSGIGPETRNRLTFGTLFLDADLDGQIDLLQVNGHIEPEIGRVQAGQSYRQSAQLFRATGSEPPFLEVPAEQLGDLADPIVGRAAASADLDRDGDIDLVISHLDAVPRILRNDLALPPGGIGRLRVIGSRGNPEAIGAKVVISGNAPNRSEQISRTRSYMSQSDLPIPFISAGKGTVSITVTFPDGQTTQLSSFEPDGDIVIRKVEVD